MFDDIHIYLHHQRNAAFLCNEINILFVENHRSDLRKRKGQKTISKSALKKENVFPRRF